VDNGVDVDDNDKGGEDDEMECDDDDMDMDMDDETGLKINRACFKPGLKSQSCTSQYTSTLILFR